MAGGFVRIEPCRGAWDGLPQYYFRPSGDNLVNYPLQEIAAGNRHARPGNVDA